MMLILKKRKVFLFLRGITEIKNMFPLGDTEEDIQKRSILWKSFDFSGNGDLSLNEVMTSLAGLK